MSCQRTQTMATGLLLWVALALAAPWTAASAAVSPTPEYPGGVDLDRSPGENPGDINEVLNINTATYYSSIATAIAAPATLAGHILEVQASYAEGPVNVSKAVTIRGLTGSEVITPTTDTGTSGDARGWFLVTVPGVTFLDLNFDGEATGVPVRSIYQVIRITAAAPGCIIDNCTFTDVIGYPLASYDGRGIASQADVTITDCVFSNIRRIGIHLFGPAMTTTVVSRITYTGKGAGDHLDYAVEFGGGARGTVMNSTVTSCTGVAADGSTSAGILVTDYFAPGTEATITGNVLNANAAAVANGYLATDASVTVANDNDLSGNTYGVANAATLDLDASGNWWGSNVLGAVAAMAGTSVDYTPWLDVGTDTSGSAGFQGDFSTLHVDDDSPQVGAVTRIQEGVNLVTASTVLVGPGTYAETVAIPKSLTLQGAGSATTSIDVSGDPTAGDVVTISGITATITIDGFTIVTGPASLVGSNALHISGLGTGSAITITNNVLQCVQSASGTAQDNFGLIAGYGSDGTLFFDHNTVYGGGDNPILIERWVGPCTLSYNTIYRGPDDNITGGKDAVFVMNYGASNITAKFKFDNNTIDMGGGTIFDNAHRGTGLSVVAQYTGGGGPGGYTDVEITNNQVVNLKAFRRGIGLWDNSSGPGDITAVITGNTISAAPAATGDHGIRILGGITGTNVGQNNVSGLGMGFQSRAWNGFDPTGFMLTGNTFTGNTTGVSVDAGTGTVTQNRIVGNGTGLYNATTTAVPATCNWWGHANGPDVPPGNPNPGVNGITGPAVYAPWWTSLTGPCDGFGPNNVAASTAGLCISNATPCVSIPVVFNRADTSPARAASVTFTLSSNLMLCSTTGASILQGTWLAGYGSTFQVVDNGGGSYTVDQSILGTPCGVGTGGQLFTVAVKKTLAAVDGTGTISVTDVNVRDCGNPFTVLPGIPGTPASITIDTTSPSAVADLAAAQLLAGNDSNGTTKINLSFTAPATADSFLVWRKGFGFYPEYDDAGGAVPTPPVGYPPAGWERAYGGTTAPTFDEPGARDFWFYVIYTKDACSNVSPVSNMTGGTLNYHLGDVTNGSAPGTGDNAVGTVDITILGNHYGETSASPFWTNYLDVGPTSNNSTLGRPLTDNEVDFDDLIFFAINYGTVSLTAPPELAELSAQPRLSLVTEPTNGGVMVRLVLSDNPDAVKGFHALVDFSGAGLSLERVEQGELLSTQAHPVFFRHLDEGAAGIHAALLGNGEAIRGSGEVARLYFRGHGTPTLTLADMRDIANGQIGQVAAGIDEPAGIVPREFALHPARPNPFNPSTVIGFALPEAGRVDLAIYDVRGRLVRTLVEADLPAGEHAAYWDGRDARGAGTSSGIYIVRLSSAGREATQKIQLMK